MRKENRGDERIEDSFYSEMDKRSLKKSCCGWQTMIIFFSILLVVTSLLTIYIYQKIKKINISFDKYYPSAVSQDSFRQKLSIDPNTNPSFSIAITSQELTAATSRGINTLTLAIENISADINTANLIFFGKMTKPLKSDLEIVTIPKVENKKIVLEIENMTAGKLTIPGILSSEIQKAFNALLDENFENLYKNYQVEKIELQADQMIISGKLK